MAVVSFAALFVLARHLKPPAVALLTLVEHYFHFRIFELYDISTIVLLVTIWEVGLAIEESSMKYHRA